MTPWPGEAGVPVPRILVRPFLPSLISAFGLIRTNPIRFHLLVFCISEPSRTYCVLQPPCAPHVPPATTLIFRGDLSLPESGWTRIVCRFGFGWINGNLSPFAAPDPPTPSLPCRGRRRCTSRRRMRPDDACASDNCRFSNVRKQFTPH